MNNIIEHAIRDYDLDRAIIEKIYKKYPDTFYEELEKEIGIYNTDNIKGEDNAEFCFEALDGNITLQNK